MRIYLVSVLFGGLGGLYMAHLAYCGIVTRSGFALLAIFWLYSGWQAYQAIRNKEIERHREWMTRNYAMTFAGAALRLWQMVFMAVGVEFDFNYLIVAWLSWRSKSVSTYGFTPPRVGV